jgi:transcriptional regulator with XRE-family HTH domain
MTHPVDNHVGRRLRYRRTMLGMTQQQLANGVGIRFQQIQKYESGANRVSASRLWDLAEAMDVPVSFFFEEIARPIADNDETGASCSLQANVMEDKEPLELVRAYYGLAEGPRQHLLALAKSLNSAA